MSERGLSVLALVTENAELRRQLAVVQDYWVELAVDAGDLHTQNDLALERLTAVERNAWHAEAGHLSRATA